MEVGARIDPHNTNDLFLSLSSSLNKKLKKCIASLHFNDQMHITGFEPHNLTRRTKLSLDVMLIDDHLSNQLFQSEKK